MTNRTPKRKVVSENEVGMRKLRGVMRLRTSYSFFWISISVILINLCLMNMNQYALMETTDPSILSLSSFFEIIPFLMNDL